MMGPVFIRLASAGLLTVGSVCADPLLGRILADDGMPLPTNATVQLICDGSVLASARVDDEGGFSLDNTPARSGCSLSASAAGYRQQAVRVSDLPLNHRIPAIVLHRLGRNQGEAVSVSFLAAPEDALQSFQAAIRKLQARPVSDPNSARQHLRSAIRKFPGYAQAWFELGRLHLAQGDIPAAIRSFQEAVRADPWFVSPYEPLILLLKSTGDADAADRACQGLRRINPSLPADCSLE